MNEQPTPVRRARCAGTSLLCSTRLGLLAAAIFFAAVLPVARAAEPTLADLRKAAKAGDEKATFELIQQLGHGEKKERTEAVTWIRKLAETGNLDGQLTLAALYAKGLPDIELAANPAEAEEWYFKAFQQEAKAAEAIMIFYHEVTLPAPKHRDAALTRLRELANGGDGDCQLLLGQTYKAGQIVPKDDFKAAEWFQKSAALGNIPAKMELADALANGRGVAEDLEESAKWIISAADDGEPEAILGAAEIYRTGKGVKQDFAAAIKYYKILIEKNDPRARYQYAGMQFNGEGMSKNQGAAVSEWDYLADLKGMPEAAYSAGLAYLDGLGVNRNVKKAVRRLRDAKAGEVPGAEAALERALAAVPYEGWTSENFQLGDYLCGRNRDGTPYKIFGYVGKKDDKLQATVSGRLIGMVNHADVSNVRLRYRIDGGKWQSCSTREQTVTLAKDGQVEFMVVTEKSGQTAEPNFYLTVTSPAKHPGTVTRYDVIEDNLEAGHYNTCSVWQDGTGGPWQIFGSSQSFDAQLEVGTIDQDLSNFRVERTDDDSGGGNAAKLSYTPQRAGFVGIRIISHGNTGSGQYRIIVNRPLVLKEQT
ncbi:MAG TPA: tetratricopeptide repeat protein [Candidatus Didemnitutus sp.]|nr:tetratricopeptide repeat protein [Candidatus Didemnitutus sp.]